MKSQTKKLRSAAACDQCKVAKRRCEGGNNGQPCRYCAHRRLVCTFSQHAKKHGEAAEQSSAQSSDKGVAGYNIDLPPITSTLVSALLDRYFETIWPIWPVVARSDLTGSAKISPLLIRSICLLSAMSQPASPENEALVESIVESVRQCSDESDIISAPSIPNLQALLLLLACPYIPNRSLMLAAACRMSLIYGLHCTESDSVILYWSCVAWAWWTSLESSNDNPDKMMFFDLQSSRPFRNPRGEDFFGQIYSLLGKARKLRSQHYLLGNRDKTKASPQAELDVELPKAVAGLDISSPEGIPEGISREFKLVIMLAEEYLLKPRGVWAYTLMEFISTDSVWFRFEPFYSIVRKMRSRTGTNV
ncbi:hypothetical protein F5884DRAFT_27832 [Xylogone sp. PMI_703]|nr:hypothetical protein F5884DRAFT_27832 [Xylogone sp. PMI_703]